MTAERRKTFCRNCGALCSLELTVEDGRITGAAPDGTASPYGGYMCPKGLASVDFHNGAEGRLFNSLRRRPDGRFEPIDGQAALDEIAERLSALIRRHGPRAVAVYHGTGAYRSVLGGLLEKAFLAAIGSPNLFSTMTIDQSAKWVTMGRMGVMASGKPALRDIDLALIAGNNPVVSHQTMPFAAGESGAPARAFEAARARGCRIIVVDPRRTETARYADLLLQPLPGHDAALFAAIAHILLRDGTWNRDFCDRFTIQIDALRAAVAPFTPELAAARTDVPVAQIELAARWLGEARRPLVGSGSGPSFSRHSNLADHMIEVVNALVGGYRRAGDPVRNPGTLKPRVFREMALSPTRSWERGVTCRTEDIGRIFGEFPTALLPREILAPGPDRIRALVSFGGDPLRALGDPARARPAFEALDLLVSLDCRMNETGKLSHYVVATSQPYERHDISIPGDALFPEPFAQYAPPVVSRPPDVVDDWAFFWGIAARMGLPLTLKYWTYGLAYEDIARGMDLGTAVEPDPAEMIRFLCGEGVVPFEALVANPGGVRPALEPRFVEPGEDDGGRLHLCPPDVAAELEAVFAEEPETRFPYRLTCRRVLEAMNSAYRDSRRALRRHPVNWAHMNPDDMRAAGLEDGAAIEIESEHGRIRALARAEDRVRRGVVSMSHMFGPLVGSGDVRRDGGANVGQLTSLADYLEPINFMPRFSGIPVQIRRAPADG